jgi:hypothetical protein
LRRVKRKTSVGNLRDEDAKQCFYPKGAYLIECSLCSLGQFLLEVPTDMKTPISLFYLTNLGALEKGQEENFGGKP